MVYKYTHNVFFNIHQTNMRPMLAIVLLSVIRFCHGSINNAKPTPTETFGNVWQLDTHGNYWMFWKTNETHITFETHVHTKGYVGFGLSTNGKMFPSDVVVGWVDSNGTSHFKDCHTVGHSAPVVDSSQDYTLLLGQEDSSGTVFKFTRKLDTCDDNDFHITDNTVKVIWSYHPNDPDSIDTMSWHGVNRRGAKSLMLLSSVKSNEFILPPDAEQFDILHDNFHVPAQDTTYQCRVFKVPEKPQKRHMIRFEPIITPGNENHVHHVVVYSCKSATEADVGTVFDCYIGKRPKHLDHCYDIVMVWAVGGVAFDFPPNAGFPFNEPDSAKYLIMETHYNNPTLKSGIIDSSGFRITMTPTLRQHDAGILETGAMVNDLMFIPPYEKTFLNRNYCHKGCLERALKTQDNAMNVFAVFLHAHLIGVQIKVRHIRGDVELEPLSEDTNYDFDYQDTRVLSKERQIRYGDSLTTECVYDSSRKTVPTKGGLSTSEEMCEAFVYYYPRHNISFCISEPLFPQITTDPFAAPRVLNTWDWRDENVRQKYKDILLNTTYFHYCNGDNDQANFTDYTKYIFHVSEPSTLHTPAPRNCPSTK